MKEKIVKCIEILLLLAGGFLTAFFYRLQMKYSVWNTLGDEKIHIDLTSSGQQIGSVLAVVFMIAVSFFLLRMLKKKGRSTLPAGVVAVFTGVYALVLLLWIALLQMPLIPDDTGLCYSSAEAIFLNNFTDYAFAKDYLARCPQQLGIVSIDLLGMRLMGDRADLFFQGINAALLVLAYLAGERLTARLSERFDNPLPELLWLVFGLLNAPAICYVNYLYGEVACLSTMVICTWALMEYLQSRKMGWLAVLLPVTAVGVLLRMNTLVFVIAAVLVLLLQAFLDKRPAHLVVVFLLVASALLPSPLLRSVYDRNPELSFPGGIPNSLYIAMGLHDSWVGPGWYDDSNRTVYLETDGDLAQCREIARADISAAMDRYKEDPAYAKDFFYRKVLTQWAEASYGSIFCCLYCGSENEKVAGFVNELVYGKANGPYRTFLSLFQGILYAGMFLGAVFEFLELLTGRREPDPVRILPWLALLGGFLFSILWEAKSRYVMEYVVLLIPYAALGYGELARRLSQLRISGSARIRKGGSGREKKH
ncbi:MAG: glycosyltransferase family 39 protein [Lachnospiraceae bacterium]|nr:glycosyltransferase family 39 protein [Lachnospiraceae bacterium]